jgi:hypothetical protein
LPLPTLDADQQKELDTLIASKSEDALKTKLAELGYDDHAKKVIENKQQEAKRFRETLEEREKELKALRDADAKRKADEDAAKAEAERKKKQQDDDEKPVKDRLAGIEETFKGELAKRDKAAEDERKKFAQQLKARDETLVKRAVISALKEKGAIDADLIATALDLSVITVEDGEVNDEELNALIDSVVDTRAHLFKKDDDDETARDEAGRFIRPKPGGPKGAKDADKMTDAEFAALEAGLRRQR